MLLQTLIKTAESKINVDTPPVVITKGKVSLADHLSLRELPLATTPGGTSFSLKALHPSEHTIKAARVPGGNENSVAICSDAVVTLPITNNNASLQLFQTANCLIPATVAVIDGGVTTRYNFNNAAFGGSVVQDQTFSDLKTFASTVITRFSKYRVTSQSVTVELIAPTLTNQGTVTAAQVPMEPYTAARSHQATATTYWIGPDLWTYRDLPSSSKWLLGATAYTGKADAGIYQPLKLDKFKWVNVEDGYRPFDVNSPTFPKTITATQPVLFPYYVDRSAATSIEELEVMFKPSSKTTGLVEFNGLAAGVSLRIRCRQVIEVTGLPSSYYAPMFERALPPDETALKMYFEVSARMADGYPASYNDLGKLKDTIYKIAKKVLPFAEPVLDIVSGLPVVGGVASALKTALPVANVAFEQARAKRKKEKAKAKASAQSTPVGKSANANRKL